MLKSFVIDSDAARRAQVCRLLIEHGVHCEPFETVEEFAAFLPSAGLVLHCGTAEFMEKLVGRFDQGSFLPVIAYSEEPEVSCVVRAMQAGAASYLRFPFLAEDVMREYAELEGNHRMRLATHGRRLAARRQLETLSKREREVLGCMLDHGTSKEIARILGISPRTVEAHRASLMARLDGRTASQAVRVAVECGAYDGSASRASAGKNQGRSAKGSPQIRVLQ